MFSEGLIVYDDLSVHQKRSCLTPSLYQVWHEPRHPALLEWYHECVRCHQKAPGCSMFHTFRKFDRHAVTRILIFVDFVYEGWWSSQVGLVAQPRPPPILHGDMPCLHTPAYIPCLHTLLAYPAYIPAYIPLSCPPATIYLLSFVRVFLFLNQSKAEIETPGMMSLLDPQCCFLFCYTNLISQITPGTAWQSFCKLSFR